MAEGPRQVRVFVSSPGDARFERSRLDRVVERLNGEFQGVARLSTIRWETEFYKAHDTFQAQIPEAAQCDIVMAIFRGRLGTELPPDFPPMSDGKPYPSGTAYELLTAIDASKGRGLPDVYVFRCPQPPLVQLDDPKEAETKEQWQHLKTFFENWFMTPDGQFKAAFQTFASTDDFETQVEALLRKWLEEKVLHGRSLTWPVELKGSPFRGLAAFGAKHAAVFFGRSRDIAKATDQLKDAAEKNCAFLLVDGASGSGKSSLVRAGLVPRLAAAGVVPSIDVWRTAIMRPGEAGGDPFAAIARALFVGTEDLPEDERGRLPALPELTASDFKKPEDLAALFAHADDTVLRPIIGTLTAIEQTVRQKEGYDRDVKAALVLVVDQLDELFDAQLAEDVRARFATLLSLLARCGRVWIIATLRADLFDRLIGQPVLKQLKEDGAAYDLAPPGVAELAEIVRGPAEAADLIYETDSATGERLDERLLKDAGRPDLLPLLQFTLNQLFESRTSSNGQTHLTFAAYHMLGGLEGAVDKEAEAAVQALGEAEQARLPRLLRELAVPAAEGGIGGARSAFDIRSVPLADAAYDEVAAKLVRALVDARILLSSGEGAQATVRLAHSRVLDSWQRAKTIVTENADFYRIRAGVEEQRRRWEASRRSRDFLVGRGRPLAEAETVLRQFPEELSPATRDYIEVSRRRARLRQRLTAAAAVAFGVIAIAASALGIVAYRSGQRAEQALKSAAQERDRAQQGLAAATELANSLVFGTVEEFRQRGETQDALKMLDRVIQSYDAVIKIDPSALAYNGRGAAYDDKNDLDRAIVDYTHAIQLNPNLDFVYNNRGVAYFKKHQYAEAIADYDHAIQINPKYAKAFDNRGDAYRGKGDFDQAVAEYSQAIALDPKYATAYSDRGNVYRDKGDLDSSLADFEQAIKLDPNVAYVYYNRALTYAAKKDLDHAFADYDHAIQIYPKYVSAFDGRGDLYKSKGDLDKAIADYSRAIAFDPKYITGYGDRGNAYRDKGDYDRSIADFTQAIAIDPTLAYLFNNRGLSYYRKRDFSHAIADYDQAVRINPNYALAFDNRGDVHKDNGELDKAISDYGQALTLDPKFVAAYNDRGNAYRDKGDLDRSLADFNEAIKLNPKLAYVFNNRGLTYSRMGKTDLAIADYDQAIQLDPKTAYLFRNRGLSYTDKGDTDKALADYDEAITLDPNYVLVYNDRGNAYYAKGDIERALADYNRAIALDPKYYYAYENRGNVYRSMRDFNRAYADYTQAITINPKYVLAYRDRGLAYAANNDFAHAIADYDEAITLDPNYASAYYSRGLVYTAMGDPGRAIPDFTRAIALNPKNANAYNFRGTAYRAQGDLDRAIADFTEAITLDPKYAAAITSRCWTRVISGQHFQEALSDCNESLRIRPNDPETLESRGFTYLRLGQWDDAIADFGAVLAINPKYPNSLYGRGLAELKKGDRASADTDMAAAKAINPNVAEKLAGYGIT
jgi:tetratricopeptide (TPR) repeat protein